jgi:DNA-binding CsgD family transcriptional regulator
VFGYRVQQIIDLQSAMLSAKMPQQRWDIALNAFADMGVDWLTAGTAPRIKLGSVTVQTSLPQSVMSDYISARLPLDDPWIQHCATSTLMHAINLEHHQSTALTAHTAVLQDVFSGHGLRQVCLMPTYGGDHPGGLVLYAKGKEEAAQLRDPHQLYALQLVWAVVAAYWHPKEPEAVKGTVGAGVYRFKPVLAPREVETLLWLSQGLQTNRIAERMRIEPVTVSKHLSAVRQKLGARTREQALVIAIKYGLITP